MLGLMQDRPLVLTHFLDRAERLFGAKEVVTATAGGLQRISYGDVGRTALDASAGCSTTSV